MNRIKILDCTLRDGGYINDFNFGELTIKNIIAKLSSALIDIIECGFLRYGDFNNDTTIFNSVSSISNFIEKKDNSSLYVAMIQYGKFNVDSIEKYDGSSVDGIRLTFHESEIDGAFADAEVLMKKGYKVFMQPVGTVTYTDYSLLNLIARINDLNPYAFYLVDTLGSMYKNDLLRMFYLIENNLNKNILLGFHTHNNLQLSFANAQELMQIRTSRTIIIDSSVFGMGRGAGNLNTELLAQFINKQFEYTYDNLQIIEVLDEYIKPFTLKYSWGYDAPYYVASITGCHPNYATFLMNKQTMKIRDIYSVLNNLDNQKKALFDKEYINNEYIKFMNHAVDDLESKKKLTSIIGNKQVVLIAPGKSLKNKKDIIEKYYSKGNYVISVNFIPSDFKVNAAFIGNMKRFSSIDSLNLTDKNIDLLVTSNITTDNGNMMIFDYSKCLSEDQCISDNSGLMCINLLRKIGIKKIILLGFDGYSTNGTSSYYDDNLDYSMDVEDKINMNRSMRETLLQLGKQCELVFE